MVWILLAKILLLLWSGTLPHCCCADLGSRWMRQSVTPSSKMRDTNSSEQSCGQSCGPVCCLSLQGLKLPFFSRIMLAHTQQCPRTSLACLVARFIAIINWAFMGLSRTSPTATWMPNKIYIASRPTAITHLICHQKSTWLQSKNAKYLAWIWA